MQKNPCKNYEIVKEIGQGSYSKVYRAIRLGDNVMVAIKIVNISKMDKIMLNSTLNEIRILHSINDEHIVGYTESFMDPTETNLWIVMEFMGGGDLACAIKLAKKENRMFPERVIWIYFIQILRGLTSLNKLKIIHRDIKPANIFLTNDQKCVKLGDMNVSKVAENDLTRTQIGTPSYLAPEIWENKQYDSRCDIYSLGCCMYEMAALRLPFEAKSMEELKQKIRNGIISPLPKQYSEELAKTIFKCLAKNPAMRVHAEKLLNSPIIELKVGEYDLGVQEIDVQSKLMGELLFPSKVSMLKNMLPKKSTMSKRSSSMANLKSVDVKIEDLTSKKLTVIKEGNGKIDGYSSSKREIPIKKDIELKKDSDSSSKRDIPMKPNADNYLSFKKDIPISSNEIKRMSDVSSKRDIVIKPVEESPNRNSSRKELQAYDSKKDNVMPQPKLLEVIKNPQQSANYQSNPKPVEQNNRMPSKDKRNSLPESSSYRDLNNRNDSSQRKIEAKNIPPSPSTKLSAIKNQAPEKPSLNDSKGSTPRMMSRGNSSSARKIEPVREELIPSMKRQDSLKKVSTSDSRRQQIEVFDNKVPLKQSERKLPPPVTSKNLPPMKNGPIPQKQNDSSRPTRYSTNPNNNHRPNESREKVMKFDDFIKNFDNSNRKLTKLKAERDEGMKDGKGQRFSSVKRIERH